MSGGPHFMLGTASMHKNFTKISMHINTGSCLLPLIFMLIGQRLSWLLAVATEQNKGRGHCLSLIKYV